MNEHTDTMDKRYNVQTLDGEIVLRDITENNAYLTAYGKVTRGGAPVGDLLVDEVTYREFALSGQKPTTYAVVRTR